MHTIPGSWKGLLAFWMTEKVLREGKWQREKKANHWAQNGIWIAFSVRYSSNYIPPPHFLPGYFSLLFPHQSGAINWQVKHDGTKAQNETGQKSHFTSAECYQGSKQALFQSATVNTQKVRAKVKSGIDACSGTIHAPGISNATVCGFYIYHICCSIKS